MKHWTFSEAQLWEALIAWAQQRNAHGSMAVIRLSADMDAVEEFLESDVMRARNLVEGE